MLGPMLEKPSTAGDRQLLGPWPLPQPRLWCEQVNRSPALSETETIRQAVQKSHPLGGDHWVRTTARKLGLESTLRRRGRPRKDEPE